MRQFSELQFVYGLCPKTPQLLSIFPFYSCIDQGGFYQFTLLGGIGAWMRLNNK